MTGKFITRDMEKLPLEVHFFILLQAVDKDLVSLCRTNTYYYNIYNDKRFWKERTRKYYTPFLHFRKRFSTWKDFYIALSKKALYITFYPDGIDLTNNTKISNNLIGDNLSYHEQITLPFNIKEIVDEHQDFLINFNVYLLFEGDEIVLDDKNNLLLGKLGEDEIYIHPEFLDLPSFSTSGTFLYYYSYLHNTEEGHLSTLGVSKIRPSILSDLFERAKNGELVGNRFDILPINVSNYDTFSNPFVYETKHDAFVRYEFPPLIIQNYDSEIYYALIPEEYYTYFSRMNLYQNAVHLNKSRFWSLFEEFKNQPIWHLIHKETIFPPPEEVKEFF